jgi:3-(3-hydroxy-phenyl)propionate hydroxylase
MCGLDIHYDLGEGHPLLGRRMPDLDLVTTDGSLRLFALLHRARPLLLALGEPGAFDIAAWADRVQAIDATYDGPWELPVIGAVAAPTAVLVRPDGYVCWVGDGGRVGLVEALTRWFGEPGAPGHRAAGRSWPATSFTGTLEFEGEKGPSLRAETRGRYRSYGLPI